MQPSGVRWPVRANQDCLFRLATPTEIKNAGREASFLYIEVKEAMTESGTNKHFVEIYIDTDSDKENQAATNVLETLDIEGMVWQTLRAVRIEQPVALTLVIS